ncbi:LANO_0C08372g1_1 [Lachancea nothofagi CBS 11611]|uniref:LANO_0C08372g1_1 n=1 Tax=Lachancea nothofagi CBS 11611 TaxID=1266666 RepID=A0A1G4J9C6_9SACH|nr:LANO_0C08372g1_1 [Lachancea nothofagi CBS 11611]
MGVHALWDIVGPTAKPVRLESLSNKRLAVDASIWIYQFLKAVRDKEGNAMRYSHIVGFFRRICKLLYFGVKPVFVFDGGAPALKRRTIQQRKERRQGRRDNAANTAKKLLARQMQNEGSGTSATTISQPHIHKLNDEYDLPQIQGFKYDEKDARINADDFKSIMESIDELDGVDLDSVNPASKDFDELPKSTQYMILSALRLKSRLRMGYSKEQLENIFPDSMDFSKFQIDMVKRRNFFTQKLMNATDTHDGGASKSENEPHKRIAGQRGKKYELVRTEDGWALSLTGADGSEISKAIVVDESPQKSKLQQYGSKADDEEDEDIDWEDVDVEKKDKDEKLDYSVKASLLPVMATTKKSGGGQSFLDKRQADSESGKAHEVLYIPDEVVWEKEIPNREYSEENDDDDDYADLTKDIQIMNSVVNSKRASKQHTADAKDSNNDTHDVDGEQKRNSITTLENMSSPTQQVEETEKYREKINGDLQEPMAATIYQPARVPTESEQNLQFVLEQIPQEDENTIVSSIEEHNTNEEASTENPKPPTPEWFRPSGPSDFNPHLGTSFLASNNNDAEAALTEDEKLGLLSGPRAAEIIAQRIDEEEERSSSNEQDLMEILPDESSAVRPPSEELDVGIQSQSTRPVPVIDYDFSEDEEDALVDQLREEEQDYDVFKTSLNPSSVNTTFADEALVNQQMRDKRDSDEVTAAMVTEVQELLTRFGIPYLTAPMEAEAQCAELLILQLVDGIITDDSDIFLFGGDKIYKNMFQEKNYVEFYYSDMIQKELGLDREKFIELAQLLGSDYTTGVKSVGPVSAMEILAEFGNLAQFRDWYNAGQFDKQTQQNESPFEKKLRKKLTTNEVMLGSEFPSDIVREGYIRPEVDHDTTKFTWGVPDLDKLRTFFSTTVGWPQEKTDEVMIPLIREVNSRKKTGIQNTLTNFFPSEYIKAGKDLKLGKRIKNASGKLKLKKQRTK